MKLLKNIKKKEICCYAAAGFLMFLCTVLTGCAKKEPFLEEIHKEAQEEVQREAKAAEAEVTEEVKASGEKEGEAEPVEIYVDVCGAVASPGVFKLEEGSRAFQAIEAAGGYLPEAAQEYINQAGFLTDGQQLYVPTKEEAGKAFAGNPAEAVRASGETDLSGGKVNLNTAGVEELTTLTGIGAARAQAIISYRETNGPFSSIEDIMKVQGIKEGTFTKIKDEIIVG